MPPLCSLSPPPQRGTMTPMDNTPTLNDTAIAAIDQHSFDAWLTNPAGENNAAPTRPSERLAAMVQAPCMTQHGRMAIMDAMLAAQIKNALEGDTAAFKMLYNELEHGGVQKTASMNVNVSAEFNDEINAILAASGLGKATQRQNATKPSPDSRDTITINSEDSESLEDHDEDDFFAEMDALLAKTASEAPELTKASQGTQQKG